MNRGMVQIRHGSNKTCFPIDFHEELYQILLIVAHCLTQFVQVGHKQRTDNINMYSIIIISQMCPLHFVLHLFFVYSHVLKFVCHYKAK